MKASNGLRSLLCATTALALLLLGPSCALALRYASPSGLSSGSCASVAAACDLKSAVEGAASKEVVIVEPGEYTVSSSIAPTAYGVTVEGAEGQPRPVIDAAAVENVFFGGNMDLSHLTIHDTGASRQVLGIAGGTLQGLLITGTGGSSVLCQCYGESGTEPMIIRDSVIVDEPGSTVGAVGINSNGGESQATLYNDTIYSESEAPAIEMIHELPTKGTATVTLTAYNTVALSAHGNVDVYASAANDAFVTMIHSDYAHATPTGVTAGEGDIAAPPLFANAAAGDFHELSGSPTIDAGAPTGELGSPAFEGEPRLLGAGVDIGAFEFEPAPVVRTEAAQLITLTSAVIYGSASAGGLPLTGCTFEYGTSTAYGSSVPCTPGALSPMATLSGLAQGTLYHYRLTAASAGGSTAGADATFTTGRLSPPDPGPRPLPTISLSATAVTVSARTASGVLKAACRAPAGTRCTVAGSVLVPSTAIAARGRTRIVKAGSVHASIPAGSSSKLTVKLTPAALRALRRKHSLSVKLSATVSDGLDASPFSASLKLKLASRHR